MTKKRKEHKEIHAVDNGDGVVATRVFKSTSTSKKRPEKRDRRSGKDETPFGIPDSGKHISREKKEEIRLQRRSEINERRQKERKEMYEKKKLDARQEKKLRISAAQAQASDDTVAGVEEESAFVARPKAKRYSDRRREDKIKRENKTPPVSDATNDPARTEETFSEQFSKLTFDRRTKGKSAAREEGMSNQETKSKTTGKREGNQVIRKMKWEHESLEGAEEKVLTEEEKRRKEDM